MGETLALAVDVESGRVDTLVRQALSVQYSDGWLYFARPSGALVAVRMEPDDVSTSGPEYPLGDVAMISRTLTAAFAVGNGVIVYGQRQQNRLVATSPTGGREVLTEEAGVYHSPRASPDGRRVVFDWDAGGLGGRDVWMLDLATRGLARVTDLGDAHDPVWTPDGREISFISFSAEGGPLFTVSADGAAGQRGMSISGNLNPGMWLRDGERYAAGVSGQLQSDLVILHADNSPPDTLLATGFDEHSPAVSPDGASLAYTSNESGLRQVYVRNFGLGGGRTLVSVGSGEEPVWSNDGSELFYVEHLSDRYRLLAARIEPGNPPSVSSHRAVVEDFRYEPAGNHVNWDVMPDGRFLVAEPESGWVAAFIFNWAPPEERD